MATREILPSRAPLPPFHPPYLHNPYLSQQPHYHYHHHHHYHHHPNQHFLLANQNDLADLSTVALPLFGSIVRTEDPGSSASSSSTSSCTSNIFNSSVFSSSPSSSESYFSREEIDKSSPSRRDGIDAVEESFLRHSYCSFIQNLGMRMKLPQSTIATAMVLCHRFFLRRSHAAYDRFVISTSCLFLAAKSEETPRSLDSMVLISYEMSHRQALAKYNFRMRNDWFEHFKEQVLDAEQTLLTALDFELTVEHPYKLLMTVFNKNGLLHSALFQMTFKLVNDGLRSSLWLQFKPHHIAAGAVFLAARFLNIDLFSNGEPEWWQEFKTTRVILDIVVQQMMEIDR